MNSYENPTLSETCDLYAEIDRLQSLNAELVAALDKIEMRAHSDASAEELEDAQRDLRHIHATAKAALAKSKETH